MHIEKNTQVEYAFTLPLIGFWLAASLINCNRESPKRDLNT